MQRYHKANHWEMSMFRFCTLVFTCMPGKLIQSVRIDLQQAAYIPVVFPLNWKSHVYKTKCETLRKHLFYFYNVQNKHLCASPSNPYEVQKHYHSNDTYIYINSRNLHRTQYGISYSHIPFSSGEKFDHPKIAMESPFLFLELKLFFLGIDL